MNILEHGVEILRRFISDAVVAQIIEEIETIDIGSEKYGVRNADKKFASIANLIESSVIQNKAQEILGRKPVLVRAIFFDKNPEKNWLVTWHQDKTIAVDRKIDIAGWGPWSIKDGVQHVQPDVALLNQMLTFRVHLDDANEDNGCLKVIKNSHKFGVMTQQQIDGLVSDCKVTNCVASAGDVLLMRPLTLHSSSKALKPAHRRVVHLEFCNYPLPSGLQWA